MEKRINLKLIVIHSIALWMFAFSFQTFGYLSNVDLSEFIRHSPSEKTNLTIPAYDAGAIYSLQLTIEICKTLGIVVGFVLSLIISRKRNWYWLNSLLAFILMMLLRFFDLLGWSYLKNLFLFPSQIGTGFWYYFINGLVMLTIGIILLSINKSINSSKANKRGDNLKYA